jgi:hypothetical protein
MLGQVSAAFSITLIISSGLIAANTLVDLGVNVYVARRVPTVLGGVAFLVAVWWLDVRVAIGLAAVITLAIISVRVWHQAGLRGVRGSDPSQPLVEFTFSLAAIASLVVGWGVLGDRRLAFAPIGFMAWGDSASGLVTDAIVRRRGGIRQWPSIAMLGIRDDNWAIVAATLGVMALVRAN